MPEQAEFCLRNWIKFDPLVQDGMNLHHKENLDKGRQIVHQKITINVWLVSDRSVISCYYPIGSIAENGKFQMVASSQGNEAFVQKYADDFKDDVLADSIIDYWSVEPKIDSETGEVTGTRVVNLNMFSPRGNIPTYVVATISAIASQPV